MENIIERSFSINLRLLKVMNLYSSDSKIRTCAVYLLIMLHIPVFGVLYFLLEDEIDMERVGDSGPVVAEMICYFFKLLPFIVNDKKIKNCIHFLEQLTYITCNEKQKKIIDHWVKICRRNTIIFLVCFVGSAVCWAVRPILLGQYRLPVDVWLPFNPLDFDLAFYSIYFYLILGVAYPATASGAVEPLVAGLSGLACCQFQILKDNLQFLDQEAQIRQCIKHHNAILQFIKEVEECFSPVVFSQLIGSMFVICFFCFRLSMLEPLSLDFVTAVGMLFALLSQIYFYCLYGTTLFEESNSLTNAIYMGNWYKFDANVRKSLTIIMERSKKPIVFTAGKILNVSLDTFTRILRRSYSLLCVLNSQK